MSKKMLQNEYLKVIHFCGINFCDLEVKKLNFCGINFCDWQNLEDFAELIFAISKIIVNISYVLTTFRGVKSYFCGINCGWQNLKNSAELILPIFAEIAKINSAKINSARINSAKIDDFRVTKCY